MMTQKKWYTSKTVWFNALTVLAAMAGGLVGLLPTLQPLLTPEVFAIATVVIGVVNLGLRSITKDAIVFKDVQK